MKDTEPSPTNRRTFIKTTGAAAASGLDVPEDGYRGAYVTDWAAELPSDVDSFEWGKERALADQREVLGLLDIEFDSWFSERSMIDSGAVAGTLDDRRGILVHGDLLGSAKVVDGE